MKNIVVEQIEIFVHHLAFYNTQIKIGNVTLESAFLSTRFTPDYDFYVMWLALHSSGDIHNFEKN